MSRPNSNFRLIVSLSTLIEIEEIKQILGNDEFQLVDTRMQSEYEGTYLKDGASRAGRIPGSLFWDWTFAIDYSGDHSFKSLKDIRAKTC